MAHLHPAWASAPNQELRRVATDDATLPVGSLAATEGDPGPGNAHGPN